MHAYIGYPIDRDTNYIVVFSVGRNNCMKVLLFLSQVVLVTSTMVIVSTYVSILNTQESKNASVKKDLGCEMMEKHAKYSR